MHRCSEKDDNLSAASLKKSSIDMDSGYPSPKPRNQIQNIPRTINRINLRISPTNSTIIDQNQSRFNRSIQSSDITLQIP